MYGYGGNVDKPQSTGDDKTEELTFKDVVWTQTADHPAKLQADTIDIDGIVDELTAYDLTTQTLHALNTLTIDGEAIFSNGVTCIDGSGLDGGYVSVDDVTTASLTVGSGTGSHEATWQTAEIMTGVSVSTAGARWYATSTDGETVTGRNYFNPVTGVTPSKVTIHYLGRPDS